MARKGNSRHMNRFAASKYMRIDRKVSTYVTKQNPGRHTLENSIALVTLLKEKMGVAADSREAGILIKNGNVLINGKQVRDKRYPVGFGDMITLKPTGASYRIDVAKKGAIRVDDKPTTDRYVKVIGKYLGKKNKVMLRLYDGSVLEGKNEVKVNDSVAVKDNAVKSIVKFSSGARCYVIKGTHASESGTIKGINTGTATRASTVEVDSGKGTFLTLVDNVMVIGE
jgi:small subunit ribosomal protein S4e